MPEHDLNLLITLNVLLAERNVARAARRLGLSPSAMSRSLARLRTAMGDPLLVRAGRGLVPTPRALELRDRVGQLVDEAESVLRPATKLDVQQLARTFTLRTSDGFVANFGAALLGRVAREAPQVRLHFVQKAEKDTAALREGTIDLETGVITGSTSPEIRTRALFRDRLVGVVRTGHALSAGTITTTRYAGERHVHVARHGATRGLVDESLESLGAEREIVAIVTGFADAVALARGAELVATVPERQTEALRSGMFTFALPFETPPITVSMMWHPRMDGDLAHKWLRTSVLETVEAIGER